ncbi:MAG: helix-turn-helix transcriptional regulator [Cyclobacteriaceae bacterium]
MSYVSEEYIYPMVFKSVPPSTHLSSLIREFWIYENPDAAIHKQKIIPDGYSEIIIHYGSPYRINMNGKWEDQSRLLFSNQISKYFFLQNTGPSAMIGIKLFPHSFYRLFGTDLSPYTDRVIPLEEMSGVSSTPLKKLTQKQLTAEARIKQIEEWFADKLAGEQRHDVSLIENAVNIIFKSNGLTDVAKISEQLGISTRHLERSFKKIVGVTPKFFSRIIRFNHIFQLISRGKESWIRVALESGYFDQSHFIKNFKEFTGEEPSAYGFEESNLANFFLKN